MMPKVAKQVSRRTLLKRAEAKRPALLALYGFKNGQPPSEATLAELFQFWKLEDHYLYIPKRNDRLKRFVKTGVLEIDPPLAPGQPMPEDLDRRYYRVLKRHRLLRGADPAPAPAPPKSPTIRRQVEAAAKEMKRAREIPKGIKRQTLARLLAKRINDPDNYRYIGKDLKKWGLWPLHRPKGDS
jgi:hypothetical protein